MSTNPRFLVAQPQPVDGDVHGDALLVLAGSADSHLEVGERLLAHAVAARLRHLQYADQLGLEAHAFAEEARRLVLVCRSTDQGK